ncbi:MAG: helix-hairpin-helix domain-containing protein [Lachnospiraceae bacterium]
MRCYFIVILLSVILLSGCRGSETEFISDMEPTASAQNTETDDLYSSKLEEETASLVTVTEEDCFIYICGAVHSPGVYKVSPGSRVFEVISLAGGLQEDASAESINQADQVMDGQMIRIYTQDEMIERPSVGSNEPDERTDTLININEASKEQLMQLPGIGESKADSIIEYRSNVGQFDTVEDIKNIAGIKDGVYTKIKDKITVD